VTTTITEVAPLPIDLVVVDDAVMSALLLTVAEVVEERAKARAAEHPDEGLNDTPDPLTEACNAVSAVLDRVLGQAARDLIREALGVTDELNDPQGLLDYTGVKQYEIPTLSFRQMRSLLAISRGPDLDTVLDSIRATAVAPFLPRGIQRKREAGWKKPPGVVDVTRPGRRAIRATPLTSAGKYGNPFVIGETTPGHWPDPFAGVDVRDAEHAVSLFRAAVEVDPEYQARIRAELAGRDLMCWCAEGEWCHRDVLLAIANSQPNPE
jgi:hypothetical protein